MDITSAKDLTGEDSRSARNFWNPPSGINFSAAFVASASRGSNPCTTSRSATASVTVRSIGSTVSSLYEMGTIPDRLVRPTIGFIPTTELYDAGQLMPQSKSVARETETKLAATAMAGPLFGPHGVCAQVFGFTS
ncbi:hypothetical protein HPP92_004633 [Vanilla planifolia]|uniref:Uncharacterized protein n=1 Tax=Vanilla planifolia TaxID=51239 RepID=A0A835VC70_VANPL|nr:hypothetical protein HPP92_004988 [Vanilla planifolia]KAG0493639.1 hypothetical protein HPP92_004633 [Vanilla planifolia]